LGWIATLPDAGLRSELTSRALGVWAADDPGKALQYTAKLTQPGERGAAEEAIFGIWSNASPDGLARWIEQNRHLASADMARQHLVSAWAESQPVNAMATAGGIQNAEMRQEMLEMVIRDWNEKDPGAVGVYLKRNPGMAGLLEQPQ
jgi:hypothetical protein